eukprot:TRINITY_DN9039_c1_g1_i1.p1 TRINITY_DN9039_c1_g1~~TRINITY_DN9039_c1_g1_i1.p1  ORF type:complete len:453 (+),score=84.59 TRINITY_DN9039_c1_g1_i1:116-1474(+)
MPRFVCCFSPRHFSFIVPEFEACCAVFGVRPHYLSDVHAFNAQDSPVLLVELPSCEVAFKIAERMTLLKVLLEYMADGDTYPQLVEQIGAIEPDLVGRFGMGMKWKGCVDAYGRKFSQEEKMGILKCLSPFKFFTDNRVSIKAPDNTFWVYEDVGYNKPRSFPVRHIWFGREICVGSRSLIGKYDVKNRAYIGTTSMDAELSLVMANMGKARPGALMLDPFAGTGSLLCTCAEFGCITFGSDIDPRVLRGKVQKGRHVNVRSNFEQYDLERFFGGLAIMDHNLSAWRPCFDLIVTDPPYGVRAGAKKVGSRSEPKEVPDEYKETHFPKKVAYELEDVLADLIVFAARSLCLGGRVVYWLPTTKGFKPTDVPTHPCMELLAYSEQPLSGRISRRLVTMEKIAQFDEEAHGSFRPVSTTPGGPAHQRFSSTYFKESHGIPAAASSTHTDEAAAE